MNYFVILVLFVFVNLTDADIIIKAPKYVPKSHITNLLKKYYQHIKELKGKSKHNVEIEIPVAPPLHLEHLPHKTDFGNKENYLKLRRGGFIRKLRGSANMVRRPTSYPLSNSVPNIPINVQIPVPVYQNPQNLLPIPMMMEPLVEQTVIEDSTFSPNVEDQEQEKEQQHKAEMEETTETLQAEIQVTEDPHLVSLRYAEERVKKLIMRLNQNLKVTEKMGKRRNAQGPRQNHIYKEDIEEALKGLEERLMNGSSSTNKSDVADGQKPATFDDLVTAISELERNILKHKEFMATSTPSPCGEEGILNEAYKPVLKGDLWELLHSQKSALGSNAPIHMSRKVLELILPDPEELKKSSESVEMDLGEELLKLIQAKMRISTITTTSVPSTSNYNVDERRFVANDLVELLREGVAIDSNPAVLKDKGLVPIKIEVPKSYSDIIIKT